MIFTLFISKGCSACKRVQEQIENLAVSNKSLKFETKDILKTKLDKPLIVPALFVNNQLYSYGEVDLKKLQNLIISDMKKI
ncbi:hypothetical protein BMS3Abin04_01084 [bacterium BMS3Abin04]|nr:hypothetical protein BMS3Abin04_01084 [bacterium BMS3Abin04]